jgi:hypothetical protein
MDQWNGQQRAVAIKMFYMFVFLKSSRFLGHSVYTRMMGTSFRKLKFFFHLVFIVSTLFPPLLETLYCGRVKLFAEMSEHVVRAVSSRRPRNVLGVPPSTGPKRWKSECPKSGLSGLFGGKGL